jgi:uncharacterized protein
MHTNQLAHEKSPYLLQHAHNPVDWHAWGPAAFEKAKRENKPIFLSIGYSTCHWCHVMERESFENEEIAEIINRSFVAIKVDREERPDIDRIYMTFVQASTGSGGWPMSVWLTPDLQPFFGGTYFPPVNRFGHPGFPAVLTQIANAWRTQQPQIADSARDAVEQLRKQVTVEPTHTGWGDIDAATLDTGFFVFRRTFDSHLGGFGGAPKFPRPSVYNFLLRYYARTKSEEALEMVLKTLREMAKGGMHDQLGGGFHRYSVDERWFVPHFEKMLYDQGQLAIAYLEAFQITHDEQYAAVARLIFDYVLRDMTDSGGAFYSAEDADSAADASKPNEKGEGAFYIWTAAEIRALAPAPVCEWFFHRYGVLEDGNVSNDPHGEFTGRNILYQANEFEDTALQFERPVEEIRAAVEDAGRRLLAERGKRPRPHLDDKVLTSWNGLMISALAKGGAVLGEPRYAEAARRAVEFIIARMYNSESGILLRRYRANDAAIPGFLDDYALFTQALLDLYETQFDRRHLELALKLTAKQRELFEDAARGAFFSSVEGESDLLLRVKEDYDGAEPSGNSVALNNLFRLAEMANREDLRESAQRLLAAFGSRLTAAPVALPQMLAACEFHFGQPRQIVIVGDRDAADTQAMLQALHSRFLPNKVVLLVDSDEARAALSATIPTIAPMERVDGRASAYVCRDYTCQLPVNTVDGLAELLQC